jgi:hypothetical protein
LDRRDDPAGVGAVAIACGRFLHGEGRRGRLVVGGGDCGGPTGDWSSLSLDGSGGYPSGRSGSVDWWQLREVVGARFGRQP